MGAKGKREVGSPGRGRQDYLQGPGHGAPRLQLDGKAARRGITSPGMALDDVYDNISTGFVREVDSRPWIVA